MNTKKIFFTLFMLASTKHVYSMEVVALPVFPLTIMDQTADCDDENNNVAVDHKSFLMLMAQAYHRTSSSINTVPFGELIKKLLGNAGLSSLNPMAGDVVWLTQKDLRYRLYPYIMWTGQKLTCDGNGDDVEDADARPIVLHRLQEKTAMIALLTEGNEKKHFNGIEHPQFRPLVRIRDFGASNEIRDTPVTLYDRKAEEILLSPTITADTRKSICSFL